MNNVSSVKEESCVLYNLNDAKREYPLDKTIHRLIEDRVENGPDHIALVFEDKQTTYREMDERANRLACLLREKGVKPGVIVGIVSERSIEMIIGIYAVLKAGGAYLPIFAGLPGARKRFMLEDSESKVLLTRRHLFEKDREYYRDFSPPYVLFLDDETIYTGGKKHLPIANKPGDLVYVIYTSGTTGEPKGVMIEHASLVNFVYSMYDSYNEDFGPGDYCLALTNISFDVSVCEIFLPLVFGSSIVLLSDEKIFDLVELARTIVDRSITFTYVPPVLLRELCRQLKTYGVMVALNKMLVGVEPIKDHVLEGFLELNRDMSIVNGYGPTETTICSTAYRYYSHEPSGKNVPIGKPLSNTKIVILDENDRSVQVGDAGELCISGVGVARGYLKRPELTAEKFVDNPYFPGERMYRTGDLARWLEDGNIEFSGRIDKQVKIRGYRVELGEIENKLSNCKGVKEAVVIAREVVSQATGQGDKYLCAYVIFEEGVKFPISRLKKALIKELPDYMVPSYFMPIETIPLTPNGKLDVKALPVPEPVESVEQYEEPRNDLEKRLTGIWREVLDVDAGVMGINADFFELGGHSLKATLMISKVHLAFNARISLPEIFEFSTIKKLAGFIKEKAADKYISIKRVKRKKYYRLSSAQKRLYILNQMVLESTNYNIPVVFELEGTPDRIRLEDAFRKSIERHESLRTSFLIVGEEPVQKIHDNVEFEIECYAAQAGSPVGESPWLSIEQIINDFVRPFDLSRAPLIRAGLIKTHEGNNGNYLLMVDMHHIISDGISFEIFKKELTSFYDGKALLPLRIQYKDYAEWQQREMQSEKVRDQEAYWLKEFAGEVPLLNLPIDHGRPAIQSFAGSSVVFEMGSDKTGKLKTLARENNSTLFMILFAVFNVLMAKLSGQEDIIVGSPAAGRRHADLEHIIGMFINTLALRNYPSGSKKFNRFLLEVKQKTLHAFENQEYQFEYLVEKVMVNRDASRNPLFDVMFVLQNMEKEESYASSLEIKPYRYRFNTSRFDLTLIAEEEEEGLFFTLEYCTLLFKHQTIERFVSYFKKILSVILGAPDKEISRVEIVTGDEKRQILYDFNNNEIWYPRDKTIHQLFEEQVERTPDNIAVIEPQGCHSITYRLLDRKANQLAHMLRSRGVTPNTVVGIMVERSIVMVSGLLAILKSGGCYLAIDPEYPEVRKRLMLEDSAVNVLLTRKDLDDPGNYPDGVSDPAHLSCPGDLLYVIYTSGSTGVPKGVLVNHGGFVNLVYVHRSVFGEGPESRFSQVASVSFDAMAFEIWPCLLSGASLCIANEDVRMAPAQLKEWLIENKITISFQPTMMAEYLLKEDWPGKGVALKALRAAGDRLTQFPSHHYPFTLYNLFGPTEDTVWTTWAEVEVKTGVANGKYPPIGKPIGNHKVFIVGMGSDGSDLMLQPIGAAGELCISGVGLARGYLNRPELTAERFIHSTLNTHHLTLYKTGDLARWRPDGSIEFLDRIDYQVKIRGFRIELEEIESCLLQHDAVEEAVVIAGMARDGEKYLCAYIVSAANFATELDDAALRQYLHLKLPDYMVPSCFVMLEKLPLTPAGKVDRSALPPPAVSSAKTYAAPGNETEKKMVTIWSEVLGIDEDVIGIDNSFFELGGHSLKGTLMILQIHQVFHVRISLSEVFRQLTIRALSRYLKDKHRDEYVSIEKVEEKDYYVLSSAQKRLYILNRMVLESTNYNLPVVFELVGEPNAFRLQDTFAAMIKRHKSFRSSFMMVEEEPVQKIHEQVKFEIEYYDVQGTEHRAGGSVIVSPGSSIEQIINDFVRPFDLSQAPLMRVGLIKTLNDNHYLMVDMHHIISDGMSFEVFIKDLTAFYDLKELFPLRIQYKDYAEWQQKEIRREEIKKQKDYWLKEFVGEIPLLNLPTDYTRPQVQSFEGSVAYFEIGNEQKIALNTVARRTNTTLFMILLALFNVLIARLSGQEDIVVGSPAAGRRHAESNNIIGMFVNTLAIRSYPLGWKTFNEFLREIKQGTLWAFENQEYPFEELVEQVMATRDTSRNPLFDTAFALQNFVVKDKSESQLELKPCAFTPTTSKFDLTLLAKEKEDRLAFDLEYSTKLFKEKTIERFIGYFKKIVDAVLGDPLIKISGIEIISDDEKQQVLSVFNDTAAGYPKEKTVHQLFEEQVEKRPDGVALVGQVVKAQGAVPLHGIHLTYGELNKKSSQLARYLQQRGVQADTIASIMIGRSIEMITGILGILKAGGAYLPIEPDYPHERIDYMLKDSKAKILLTASAAQVKEEEEPIERIDIAELSSSSTSTLTSTLSKISSANLAYVIYTSGSTGRPKGTLVEHRSLVNLCFWHNRYYGITEKDNTAQYATFGFDASVWEIFPYLVRGASVHIISDEIRLDIERLNTYYVKHHIAIGFLPTQFGQQFMEEAGENPSLRALLTGGDRLNRFVKRSYLLYNNYGPTESTVVTTACRVEEYIDNIPIGKPIQNIRVYVMDKFNSHFQPIGMPGELYIGGDGLARGYLNRPELTAEKFIHSTLNTEHLTLYKTGDLVRWLPDGNIEFLGRIDQQIKIRGFRVELGEIESRLTTHPDVREAVVRMVPMVGKSRFPGNEDKLLCAYIVPHGELDLDISGLQEYLSAKLPAFMIPSFFVRLEKIPLTSSGKVDSKGLPLPDFSSKRTTYAAPENKIQQKLVEIWSVVLILNNEMIGIDDNFFELGGHSLKGTVVIMRIHKEFAVKMSLSEMFRRSTIRRLSAYIEEAAEEKYVSIENEEEKEYCDLSYAQRRLWILCQFEEDSTAYNIPGVFVVNGKFNTGAYDQAIQALTDRHESLRTVFLLVNGEPKQRVIGHLEYHVEYVDLRNSHHDPQVREQRAREIFRNSANFTFNLEQGPLYLFKILRLEDEKYLLILNIHHIVSDGWSHGIICNEIFTLYNAFSKGGKNPLEPLNLQYKDYTRWHNKLIAEDHFRQSENYWLEKLKDKPNGIELPLDHHRKPIQTFNGRRIHFCIDKEKTLGLHHICNEESATLFMGLLSLCDIFLYKYTGQRDILVGAPIAGRKRTELNGVVGFFVNTLVYRIGVNPGESFRDLLRKMKKETLDCYEYQDYPFDLLIDRLGLDRDLSQSPLFNVMLAHNNSDTLDSRVRMEGLTISDYPYRGDFNMSKFDLIFFMDEIGGFIDVFLEYNSDLFEGAAIERMVKNFLVFLENVLREPEMPISDLNYLHEVEYEKVTKHFNSTSYLFRELSIQELFENQVRNSRDKTAVVDVDGTDFVTYGELNKRANQVAWYLREEYSIKPGDVIGISVDRSPEMVIAVLGVVKSGAGYVAIDPNYPEERVLHMLSDSRAGLLIIDEMRPELVGDYKGKILNIHSDWQNINLKSNQNLGVLNQPSDILYVIYTSGSTGVPNGAMLSHGILTNLVQWQIESSSIDASLRCLQFTSVNFCVSFQEIMITLTAGGELHLIGDIERQDVDYLMDFLNSHRIELLYLPFSYLNFLFNESGRFGELNKHYLKHIVTAGEQLKITSGLRKFLAGNPGIKLHNHYGSSEMHVVTSYTLDAATMDQAPIPPAGKPIANTRIYILDDYYHPVSIGVWGELFVEGHSEVPGYINNSGLTNQKLVDHPVFSPDHKRLYRSGDLGRWLEDGNIELKGRKDTQIKIRGFRVELGEIESKILLMEAVRDCVVVVKEDKGGQKHLVAYIVGKGNDVEPWEVKQNIAKFLPQYMIPQIVILDRLPLMPNGKVDRDNLPEPENLVGEEYIAPRNKIEKTLTSIWSGLLGIEKDRISVHANFFDVGGHSMKATVMVSDIHKAFNVKVPLTEIFRGPTISEIAECIRGAAGEKFTSIEPTEKKEYYALSPAQKRLCIIQQLDSKNIAYNLPQVLCLEGKLDVRKLGETFQKLVNRHESFRTSFIIVNDEPVQKINDNAEFEIEYYKVEFEDKVEEISKGFVRPFDLSQAPLLRVGLAKKDEEQWIFMVDMHHIIADGVSYTIFVEELMALYEGKELPESKLHYKDYSEWQKRMQKKEISTLRKQESFWLKEFEKGIPVLEVPTDYERPEVLRFEGSHLTFEIGKDETETLRKFVKEQDVTLFMVSLAVFYVLLAKNSGQEDIVVGIPVMGRRHADLQPIIGMFVNTLALRNYPRSSETFKEFLSELRARALKAFDNQDYSFEELVARLGVKRKTNRGPLFDVIFGLQNLGDRSQNLLEIKIPGLKLIPYDTDTRVSRNDLCLYLFEKSDGIDCLFENSTQLFEKETIEILREEYLILLRNVLENIDCRIGDLDYKPEIERTLTEFEDIEIDF